MSDSIYLQNIVLSNDFQNKGLTETKYTHIIASKSALAIRNHKRRISIAACGYHKS